jgi:hypothetical protein
MAHTIKKEVFSEELQKYISCEVLVLDEEEGLPKTDFREILLFCENQNFDDDRFEDYQESIIDSFPETQLIEQYDEFNAERD